MDADRWEKHTLLADDADRDAKPMMAVLHYHLALAESQQLSPITGSLEELDELLTIKVMSCHNLANFWRMHGDSEYELKYLQLATEEVMALLPQCPNTSCKSFISSLGCCKSALIEYLKRHPNPIIAKHVERLHSHNECELIVKFQLH